ncbi:twin transmembrane helix small protein [Hahella sp. SMD15-11]|uniref:Twin transmembrane helix small protein n=1 Tax=Thermohahella caldifontis TaxID=3142973 RepID=A0AB39UTB0_9GAMM
MKALILVLLLGTVVSLFSALFFLVRDQGQRNRTVWALTARVGFSVALLITVLVLYFSGHLVLHGPGIPPP